MFNYTAPNDLLKERIILVTGAGDGIGRATALAYAKTGATVILLGRTEAKLDAVYDEIEAAGGAQPAIIPMDLDSATEPDYIELSNTLFDTFGRLDGVVHNAGVLGARTSIENYDPITWEKVMRINLTAPFIMTQTLLPLLRRSEDASVIFTSSGVGRKGRAYWGAYAVSKFATEGLMQTLADEIENEPNLRVNAINPGGTRTPMRAYAYPAEDPFKLPTPEEIQPAYLFLMGPDSKQVNGQSIDAQGDMSASQL